MNDLAQRINRDKIKDSDSADNMKRINKEIGIKQYFLLFWNL